MGLKTAGICLLVGVAWLGAGRQGAAQDAAPARPPGGKLR